MLTNSFAKAEFMLARSLLVVASLVLSVLSLKRGLSIVIFPFSCTTSAPEKYSELKEVKELHE